MIVATGTDLVEVPRLAQLLARDGDGFRRRVFTEEEARYCDSQARPAESFAARFAAKEAVLKCLGTGWGEGIGFADVEVVRAARGALSIQLHGLAADRARRLGIGKIHLSVSHTARYAVAFAVAESC
jgi:holo-[acyl-carrier protein] synthase